MNNEIIDELQIKYPFLTPLEAKTLYFIAKNNIDYNYVELLKTNQINEYLKRYVKNIRKINTGKGLDSNVEVESSHLDVLELLKKKKVSLKKICKVLQKTKDINISYYPFNKQIIKSVKNNSSVSRVIGFFLMATSLSLMVYSIINISAWHNENVKIDKISTDINEKVDVVETRLPVEEEIISDDYFKYLNVSLLDVDLNELLSENDDTKGWIKVNGTNINYPFVQASDNEYYLTRSFDGEYNKKGWVFLDYRNDINNLNRNTILYAHGLVNNAMFGSLRKVIKNAWAENTENRIIKMSTLSQNLLWEVFSSYTIEPEGYYITTDFSSDEEYEEFLNKLKDRSFYNYGVDLDSSDKILTLSSCYDNSKRMVLHAKLIAVSDKDN